MRLWYSRKGLVRVPIEQNLVKNFDVRQIYARSISLFDYPRLVFFDETGVNLHQVRNYGHSPIKNTRQDSKRE